MLDEKLFFTIEQIFIFLVINFSLNIGLISISFNLFLITQIYQFVLQSAVTHFHFLNLLFKVNFFLVVVGSLILSTLELSFLF
jgi:hypothetical protein